MEFKKILHGGDYNPEQWITPSNYKQVIDDDLARLKYIGINLLTVGVFNWANINPSEGIYNFDYMDYLLLRAKEENISIIMSTPSGGFPNWLKIKYEDINRVGSNGVRRTIGDRHNHCYSSSNSRNQVTIINEIIAKRYKEYPFVMWHISNEMQGECYCSNCVRKFREWLFGKYKTIDNLNDAWNMNFWSHTYNKFSEINPPFDYGDGSNPMMRLEWNRFTSKNAIDFYTLEVEAIKKHCPGAKHTANLCYGLGHNFNYNDFAKHMDIVSWDSYHEWNKGDDYKTAKYAILNHDLMRGFKQENFFMMESTPNTANWRYASKSKRPGVNEITSILALACGSQSVGYFQMRRSRNHAEMFHSAVLDDFVYKNRFEQELRILSSKLEKMDEILNTSINNEIAILFDYETRDLININVGPRKGGGMGYCEYFEEIHEAFTTAGHSVDVINFKNELSSYKIIIIPMHFGLSEENIKQLEQLKNSGTKIIITAFTGLTDQNNNLQTRGFNSKFSNLLGCKLLEYEALYDNDSATIEYNGSNFKTKVFHQYVKIDADVECKAIYQFDLYNESPAITYKEGVLVTHGLLTGQDLYTLVAGEFNLETSCDSLLKRTRENEKYIYNFYFNFTGETIDKSIYELELLTNKMIENKLFEPYEYLITRVKK